MKLKNKALLLVTLTIGVLTLTSVMVSKRSISLSFSALEHKQSEVEAERALRLLDQQLTSLSATLMDYAYWNDTAEFAQGVRTSYFTDNFATDNMKSLGIAQVLVLDSLGRPVASAELTDEPALRPASAAMVQALRALAVPVLSDTTSQTVVRTYHQRDGTLYLVAVAAVRSQFELGTAPKGALAMVRRFGEQEITHFGQILMHPVRLEFPSAQASRTSVTPEITSFDILAARAPVVDHEGRIVAELVVELPRDLHQSGRTLAFAAGFQVATAGLVVGLLLLLLLDRLLLHRLSRVHKELAAITAQGLDGDALVQERGSDEIADVATGINHLLNRVRSDAVQQREAHLHHERLQQQLLQSHKTDAMGRFTSGIAHDFNNSLAAIKGWILLAMEDIARDHPGTESLNKALESVRYGDGLMRQLLAYSRQTTPRLERFQLGKLAEEARDLVSLGLMGRCTLYIHLDTTNDWVRADPTQIKQVVVNLLINAYDAMNGQGTITMRLSAGPASANLGLECSESPELGPTIQLSIQDTGPGIPRENLNRIFEPFFTTKPPGKGTGLGLSVVQGIVARHHGSINVTSEPGKGSCFILLLPLNEAQAPEIPGNEENAESGPKSGRLP